MYAVRWLLVLAVITFRALDSPCRRSDNRGLVLPGDRRGDFHLRQLHHFGLRTKARSDLSRIFRGFLAQSLLSSWRRSIVGLLQGPTSRRRGSSRRCRSLGSRCPSGEGVRLGVPLEPGEWNPQLDLTGGSWIIRTHLQRGEPRRASIFVTAVGGVPLAYLLIMPAMKSVDSSFEEASRVAGRSSLGTAYAITSRLLLLTLGSATPSRNRRRPEHSRPLILGQPAGFRLSPHRVYYWTNTHTPPSYGDGDW